MKTLITKKEAKNHINKFRDWWHLLCDSTECQIYWNRVNGQIIKIDKVGEDTYQQTTFHAAFNTMGR